MLKRAVIIMLSTFIFEGVTVVQAQNDTSFQSCLELSQASFRMGLDSTYPIIIQPEVGQDFHLVDPGAQTDRTLADTANVEFLEVLDAMPEAAGIALGLDRLAMMMTDRAAIDDVVAFTPEDL